MSFLYFVSNKVLAANLPPDVVRSLTTFNGEKGETALKACGLGHLVGQSYAVSACSKFQDDQSGYVVAPHRGRTRVDFPCGYYPDAQEWYHNEGAGYWVGFYRDARPGPDDLLLAHDLETADHTLNDGHTWKAPIAPYLPRVLGVGFDGKPLETPVERYAALGRAASVWLDTLAIDAEQDTYTFGASMMEDLVDESFRAVYGITLFETRVLGLFLNSGMQSYFQWGFRVTGSDFVKKYMEATDSEKKNGELIPDSSGIDSGARGASASPAAETSSSTPAESSDD